MAIDKKQLSEEDIKRLYITPAIENRWSPENSDIDFLGYCE